MQNANASEEKRDNYRNWHEYIVDAISLPLRLQMLTKIMFIKKLFLCCSWKAPSKLPGFSANLAEIETANVIISDFPHI